MRGYYIDNKREIDKIFFSIATIVFIYVFLNYIFSYVAPFIFGFVLSILMEPLVNLLQNRFKLHRGFSSAISLFLIIGVLGNLSFLIIDTVRRQAIIYYENYEDYIQQVLDVISNIQSNRSIFFSFIPIRFEVELENIINELFVGFSSILISYFTVLSSNIIKSVPNFFLGVVIFLISAFLFSKDKYFIKNSIKSFFPQFILVKASVLKDSLITVSWGYVRAQLIIMSIIACICTLGLLMIGSTYAILIGIVIACLDALPIFGSGFILWPWIAFELLSGDHKTAVYLAILYVALTLTNQTLQPKLIGNKIGIHPLIIIISIYICLKLFGIAGIIVGPLIVIILKTIYSNEIK